jgi:predicted RND superfamily exporter protein
MARDRLVRRIFTKIVALRVPVLVLFAVLVPASAMLALRIPSEGTIDRLIVPSDPDNIATRAFQKLFPEGQLAILLFEAPDPWRPEVLEQLAANEKALSAVPKVTVYGVLDIYRRVHPDFTPTRPGDVDALRRFATEAKALRRQGLVGDHFLGVAVSMAITASDLTPMLASVDVALASAPHDAFTRVRKVGAPYVESWIARESSQATLRYFPLLATLVVAIALFLYRSGRTLVAMLLALGSAVSLSVGAGALLGFSFTLVSALVPLTIMVTTLATLVYLQSRFVDQPEGVSVDDHQVFALTNKLLPVTASTVAAVLGFAALSVSDIRPIREMGIWTAVGLALSWVVAFTLFPALQKVLRTPTGRIVPVRTEIYDRLSAAIPAFTWRWRWPLVVGSVGLMVAGAVALFGIPGHVTPMRIGVDSIDYVDPHSALYQDIVWFRRNISGLNVARVWVRTPPGAATDPEVLRGLDRFMTAVEQLPDVSSAIGPTTFLRMRRYLAGQGETLPDDDPQEFARLTGDVEQLMLTEPELRGFIDVGTLSNVQLTVMFRTGEAEGFRAMIAALRGVWDATAARDPALHGASMQVVGEALLQAKVGANLVPTLTESFGITAALILVAFVFVFRSASARLMAMIPSLFAILVTFLGMRIFGAALNVATILIATTVLGTTENDQIHFFHHLQEGQPQTGFEQALRHTLRVSGRAIVFATLINAAGFLGLALSSFPPLRQFGVVTSAAFVLAMIADFTALPASMWLIGREHPAEQPEPARPGELPRREHRNEPT